MREAFFPGEILFTFVTDERSCTESRRILEGCLARARERAMNDDNEESIGRSIGLKEDEIDRLEDVYAVFLDARTVLVQNYTHYF